MCCEDKKKLIFEIFVEKPDTLASSSDFIAQNDLPFSTTKKSSYPKVPTTFRISVSILWIILFCNNKPSHQTVAKDWPLLSLSFSKVQINYILFILKFTSDYTFVLKPITPNN